MNNYKVETSIVQNTENEKKSFNSLSTIEIPNNIFFSIAQDRENQSNSYEDNNVTIQWNSLSEIGFSRSTRGSNSGIVYYSLYHNTKRTTFDTDHGDDEKWKKWFKIDQDYYIMCKNTFSLINDLSYQADNQVYENLNIGIRIKKQKLTTGEPYRYDSLNNPIYYENIDVSDYIRNYIRRNSSTLNISNGEYISDIQLIVFSSAPDAFDGIMSISIEDTSDFSKKYSAYYEFIKNKNDQIKKIINLSIQAQPGLEFYINNNLYPIIIGSNGLFSWEIKQPNTYIYSVKILRKIDGTWPDINPMSNIIVTYEYLEENNE